MNGTWTKNFQAVCIIHVKNKIEQEKNVEILKNLLRKRLLKQYTSKDPSTSTNKASRSISSHLILFIQLLLLLLLLLSHPVDAQVVVLAFKTGLWPGKNERMCGKRKHLLDLHKNKKAMFIPMCTNGEVQNRSCSIFNDSGKEFMWRPPFLSQCLSHLLL